MQRGMVLDTGSDDVIARRNQAGDRQIVAFGASAGKNDLRRAAPEQPSYIVACIFDCCARFLPMVMD
jgi:hypothetical protein